MARVEGHCSLAKDLETANGQHVLSGLHNGDSVSVRSSGAVERGPASQLIAVREGAAHLPAGEDAGPLESLLAAVRSAQDLDGRDLSSLGDAD